MKTQVYNIYVIQREPVVKAEKPVSMRVTRNADSQGARRERLSQPGPVQNVTHLHRASRGDDGTREGAKQVSSGIPGKKQAHEMHRACRREPRRGRADDGYGLLSRAGPCCRVEQTKDKTSCVCPFLCVDPKDDQAQEQSLCRLHITCAHSGFYLLYFFCC